MYSNMKEGVNIKHSVERAMVSIVPDVKTHLDYLTVPCLTLLYASKSEIRG